MCGIVGFSSPKGKSLSLDKIRLLLFANQERGKDSLGYYTPVTGIIKDTGKPEDIMSKKDFTIPDSNLFIGHTRSATVGEISKKNAHPFNYGNIVLAMNGTLDNPWELCREYNFPLADYDVDSQVLTAMLNRDQNKEPLTKILGGCAVLYTDTTTGRLYAYRNSERPLYRGMIDDCMYISSLESSLKVIGCLNVKEFRQDILYEIAEGRVEAHIKVKKATPPVVPNANGNSVLKLNFQNMKSSELVGMFLTPMSTCINAGKDGFHIVFGYGYEVVGASPVNNYDLIIKDHKNIRTSVAKFMFKEEQPIIGNNDYVFATSPMFYSPKSEKGKEFAAKGELLKVIGVNKNEYECLNLLTELTATVPKELVRFAYKMEVSDYKTSYYIHDDKTTPLFPTVPNLTPNTNFTEIKIQEEEMYKLEVENTACLTYEQLVDFTLQEITDKITDLEEMKQSTAGTVKLNNIKVLLENFQEKSLKLLNINV